MRSEPQGLKGGPQYDQGRMIRGGFRGRGCIGGFGTCSLYLMCQTIIEYFSETLGPHWVLWCVKVLLYFQCMYAYDYY